MPLTSTFAAAAARGLGRTIQNLAELADEFFENVTLLLPGNGTNGAQNNTFLDSSANAFTITRNGNTTQGTFSPYGSNWSNYFDGSGDWVTTPNVSAFDLSNSTTNFTIEAWVYNTGAGTVRGIMGARQDRVGHGWCLYINTNNTLYMGSLIVGNAYADRQMNTTVIPPNSWAHVALVKTASGYTGYVNGVGGSLLALTGGLDYQSGQPVIVGALGSQGEFPFLGYITDARIVKGTAVYTSNFTPSTSPLTAITNTSLLTCQSNRFRDASANNFPLTVFGNTSVQRFSPFSPTTAYSTTANGGSGYFDGSGDYLNAGSSSAFAMGTGAYTVEMWVYVPSNANQAFFAVASTGGLLCIIDSGSGGLAIASRGSAASVAGGAVQANAWNHLVFCRASTASNQTAIFVNGARTALGTDPNNYTTTGPAYVGALDVGGYDVTGYISGLRVVKGTAVYDPTQTTLTVPTAPLTAITNTSLLLNFTNAGIIDNAMMNDLETVGNAQISTAQSKFGGGSLAFDGTGDYMTAPNSVLYAFGTGDFTVECWVYVAASKAQVIWDSRASGPSTTGIAFVIDASNFPYVYVNGATLFTSSTALTLNTWTHLAFVKSSGTIALYINGVKPATGSAASATSLTDQACTVGTAVDYRDTSATFHFNGYIDDLRITKGVARYTANFNAPTAPFPTR